MLNQVRSFLTVIEETSLNRAATRLRMSQPALSRQMQALENEIGGKLLERTSSGVQATDVGFTLAKRIRPIIAAYEAAMTEARRLARGEKDQLRIGYLGSTAQEYLKPALKALRHTFPKVKVKLLDLSPGEQITALRKGEIDIALIGQEGCLLARDFYTRKLATLSTLAFVPADHALASRKRIRLVHLKNERFIGAPDEDMPGYNRWITQLCRKAGFRAKIIHEGKSLSHGLELIVNENAVGIFPAHLKNHPAPGIVAIPIEDSAATWDLLVVWQRGKSVGPTHAFLDGLPSVK
jgi:DNA-binding transcriptional LysR family regulator